MKNYFCPFPHPQTPGNNNVVEVRISFLSPPIITDSMGNVYQWVKSELVEGKPFEIKATYRAHAIREGLNTVTVSVDNIAFDSEIYEEVPEN